MAYGNTTLLGLNQPTTGQESGVWGDDVNNGFTQLVDISVAGTNNITYDGDVTLSVGNGNNASSYTSTTTTSSSTAIAQYAVLNCTGARTAGRNIIVPSLSKLYVVYNNTSGGFSITVKKTSGTGVAIAPGEKALCYYDNVTATDVIKVLSTTTLGTVTTGTWNASVIGPTYGGTNQSTYTTGDTLYASASNTLSKLAIGSTSQVLTVVGGVPAWANAATGTVTSVSVASANGFAGTSSGGATPALTLSTSISGVLKGNGTALSAATAGTDYVAPATATTFTATQIFNGSSSTFATTLLDANETVNVVASAPSSTTNFYVQSGGVQYYTSNAANNWTLNIAFSSGTSLNTALSTGQSVTFTLVTTQGSTAYYNNAVTIDGTSVTPKWIGGAPTAGNASGLDVYRFAVVKTASATYTVLASLTQYK